MYKIYSVHTLVFRREKYETLLHNCFYYVLKMLDIQYV